MNIYVDEAGVFVVPTNRQHLVCCLVGLVIPSLQEADTFYDYLRLRDQWPRKAIELKGSSLNESQISAVIDLIKGRV